MIRRDATGWTVVATDAPWSAPQVLQKRAPGTTSAWQLRQASACRVAPQVKQNLAPSG
ncbi:uncharacterized protein PD653_3379 [Nocardioides sp. PD653]|nr:uncharacterized protein PD653B2_2285 [Nocardioides sp. PD653-B2]GAW55951.1 uncharacterized protein PD653_3379 [Nocardioides sp. PD653]